VKFEIRACFVLRVVSFVLRISFFEFRYCTASRRIALVAVNVLPPKNNGAGSQLTLLNGTETVTVTGWPYPALLGFDGLMVMVVEAVGIFAEVR
jgi:hypothetical protein